MENLKIKIKGCKDINHLGEFIKTNNIRLVLFGEYHGFPNEIPIKRKIIKNVKLDFFLYEMLEEEKILSEEEARKFLSKSDNEDFSVISTYGQLKAMIKLARSFDLPIIGCDIRNMCCKHKNWREKGFSKKEGEKITKKREFRQAKVINEYTSKGLVFASLGIHHLRRDSLVLAKLKEKKAIVVKPLFNWEERFNDSNKFNSSEISYVVELMDNKS